MRTVLVPLLAALFLIGCDSVSSEDADLDGKWYLRRDATNQKVYALDIEKSNGNLRGDAERLLSAPDSVTTTAKLTGLIDAGDVRMTIVHSSSDTAQFNGYFTSDDEPGYAVEGNLRFNGVSKGKHYLQRR
ncbi:MAG TPA: hypothetical protein VJ884_10170 [Salinibacter sp.]|nr:hypothetical protein [Salinibacter sp.]